MTPTSDVNPTVKAVARFMSPKIAFYAARKSHFQTRQPQLIQDLVRRLRAMELFAAQLTAIKTAVDQSNKR
ncbi:hypothetical protein E4U57_005527 [Claviceps arundinis]|uniref:Uncharacterized protein n=1 Tax=Claviceps arundinis TaxID=1623583 RepID=A0A9P7MQ50_9HYPO|nr:hypothetical protein E4U57_005527 [Claviceps arundinis]KAG5965549.1 hypothetical protein E4U56_001750 [Claviceps arundinis]